MINDKIKTSDWGYEKVIEENDNFQIKVLYVTGGGQIKYHYHNNKKEVIYFKKGCGIVITDGFRKLMEEGEFIIFPEKTRHSIMARTTSLTLLEISNVSKHDEVYIEND